MDRYSVIKAILAPTFALIAALIIDFALGYWLEPASAHKTLHNIVDSAIWLAVAWLTLRIMDAWIFQRLVAKRLGHVPPRLFTDLFRVLVGALFVVFIAGQVFDFPVAAIVTTSSVAVAVLGFALRDVLASLFAGIALNVERPYVLGDWLEISPNQTGRVIEISWLSTRLMTKEDVLVVVPNSCLATQEFMNYGQKGQIFRDHFNITLAQDLDPARVERILLTALASAPQILKSPAPDIKIDGFVARGVVWRVRYWLDDFSDRNNICYAGQRAVMAHLFQAGIKLPSEQHDIHRTDEQKTSSENKISNILGRCPLFAAQSETCLDALAASVTTRSCRTGEEIVIEGGTDRSLFIVVEGWLQVIRKLEGEQVHKIGTIHAGEAFGEYALLTGKPRGATVRAASACRLLEITSQSLQPILALSPGLAADLSNLLAEHELANSVETLPMEVKQQRRKQASEVFLQKISALFHLN